MIASSGDNGAAPANSRAHYDRTVQPLKAKNGARGFDYVSTLRLAEALVYQARLTPDDKAAWNEAVQNLRAISRKADHDALALLAEVLARAGKHAETRHACDLLTKSGYRHPAFVSLLVTSPELSNENSR